jgi:hypothetical protein
VPRPGPVPLPQSPLPQPAPEPEAIEVESYPGWEDEWQEGVDRESREIEVETQPYRPGQERELLERLRATAEAAVAARRPRAPEPIAAASEPVEAPPPAVARSARWLRDELHDPESIRAALVLREVLGPPRAHRRSAR